MHLILIISTIFFLFLLKKFNNFLKYSGHSRYEYDEYEEDVEIDFEPQNGYADLDMPEMAAYAEPKKKER